MTKENKARMPKRSGRTPWGEWNNEKEQEKNLKTNEATTAEGGETES